MTEEEIIRDEAKEFTNDEVEGYVQQHEGHKMFRDRVKSEVLNFYNLEHKIIFFDEVKNSIFHNWENHKKYCPNTKAGKECPRDKTYTKFLFYIDQEINELPRIVRTQQGKSKTKRDKVFISYSHVDKDHLEKFRRHFRPFEKQIEFWDDTKIDAGDKWKEKIDKAIKKCKIAVLLISADFFDSRFITNEELPPLLKAAQSDGATILSVILKPCLFNSYPEISQFQAINDPSKTIIQMDEATQELTWVKVVSTIQNLLNKKEEIEIEINNMLNYERAFSGEANFLYTMKFKIGHLGYDMVKAQIQYSLIKGDGEKEEMTLQDIGLLLNEPRDLMYIPWKIELTDIDTENNKMNIKLIEK